MRGGGGKWTHRRFIRFALFVRATQTWEAQPLSGRLFPHPKHTHTHAHYHGGAVLRPAGQHVVIVGAPVDVEDRPSVTYHHGVILVHAASLVSVWTQEKSVEIRTLTYSSEVMKNQDLRIKTHVNLPSYLYVIYRKKGMYSDRDQIK